MSKQLTLEGNFGIFWRVRQRKTHLGTHHTEEAKQHIRDSSPHLSGENHPMYGKYHTKESKQLMSDNHWDNSGEKNPMYGYKHTEVAKQEISDANSGENHPLYNKNHTETTRQLMSKSKSGEKNGNWKGGVSFEPYCEKFDDEFKERIRDFFGRCCYVCNKNETENGQKLSVHHVNYDKMVCCNDVKPLFVPLCRSCHAKTHKDCKYWEEFFTVSLEYLTGGKCFLPKKCITEEKGD